jgi:RNA polymerase sigma factor (sigma-70 family)
MGQRYTRWTNARHAVTNTTRQEEEQKLLGCLAQGEAIAFWTLWERYRQDLLYPCCLRWMGGNHADAEDALSSASLKAWQGLAASAHEIANVRAWLLRLLYNLCMDMRKSYDRRNAIQHVDTGAGAGVEEALVPVQESAEAEALRREMELGIYRAIENLPPRLRAVSRLNLLYGMPSRDIAVQLNLGSDNVRKRLQQARAILQKQLTAYLDGKDNPSRGRFFSPSASGGATVLILKHSARA